MAIIGAQCDNRALRILCVRPSLTENFFWSKCKRFQHGNQMKSLLKFTGIEFASQVAYEDVVVDTSSAPGSDVSDTCKRLRSLLDLKPGTAQSCCTLADLHYLGGEPGWVEYARRWKSLWDDTERRQHTRLSKQEYHQKWQTCTDLAQYCEEGVRPSRIQSLPCLAIGIITMMLIDWMLLARVVAISVHSSLTTAQWKIVQEMGAQTEGKISEYLNWIRSRYPCCPNGSTECQLMRTQTAGYINFILKNLHCDWASFHTHIQQLENGGLNTDEIATWCRSNNFDLSTDG